MFCQIISVLVVKPNGGKKKTSEKNESVLCLLKRLLCSKKASSKIAKRHVCCYKYQFRPQAPCPSLELVQNSSRKRRNKHETKINDISYKYMSEI